MKLLVLSLLVVSALGADLAHRQKDVNTLLFQITEPIENGHLKEAADNFNPLADLSNYSDNGYSIKKIMKEIEDDRMLEKRHWFSLFNPRQREEALMLVDVLMHCKTWEAAVQNAAYFRKRMNEGEFVYALYAAVVHSSLAEGIVLPPLYEVTPHMFVNSEVVSKAYTAQMTQTPGKFRMNFTGSQKNPEQRVAYFGEDIGMNVHHVTWHLDFPFWWEDHYGYNLDRKGELFFWAHHQLSVRFDAERLSNHLDLVDELYWDKPIVEGFAPHTTYRYGGEFPARPDNVNFEDVDGVVRVRDMIIHESRIRDAIAHGYVTAADGSQIDIRNKKGIDILGDVIESSMYSPNARYYGALHNEAHILLGRQSDPHGKFKLPPGVMEHFETATRDPAFFRLHKYMDGIFKEHKDSLPAYTKDELDFPEVTLENMEVEGELQTFFEDFEFDLDNGVDVSDNVAHVDVSAIVSRINHKPFKLNFDVKNSGGEKHGVIRVFLCPHEDANGIVFTLEEQRWYCIEMDKFWVKLAPGENKITRASEDSSVTVPDVPSFKEIIKKADAAVESGSDLHLEAFDRSCGIPNRLLLPKGKTGGMKFDLMAVVTDGATDTLHDILEKQDAHGHAQCGVHGEKYPDHQPMGFPFDRRFDDDRTLLGVSNFNYDIVKIYHKDE